MLTCPIFLPSQLWNDSNLRDHLLLFGHWQFLEAVLQNYKHLIFVSGGQNWHIPEQDNLYNVFKKIKETHQ